MYELARCFWSSYIAYLYSCTWSITSTAISLNWFASCVLAISNFRLHEVDDSSILYVFIIDRLYI